METIEFFTVKQVAEALKVCPNEIYRLIKLGKIRATNISTGKKPVLRIPLTELQRLHAQAYEEVI